MAGGHAAAEKPEHPRFEVGRRIGAGGFGVVYEAFDRARGATVALKTLKDLSPASLLRLKQEFRGLADVAHPGLVTLHDLCFEGDECFFTMELVDGRDVVDWVRDAANAPPETGLATETVATGVRARAIPRRTRAAGGFDEARLRAALAQLVDAVRALHAVGKLHRDLKPSNVLVREDGRLSILDYGLVEDRDALADRRGFEGTAAYAAPEQATGAAIGPSADWYAVGVILYEALTGEVPFDGTPVQILADKQLREPPPIAPGQAPDDLVELCAALLARDPAARPTGDAIASRLSTAASTSAKITRPRELTVLGRDAELARLRAAWTRRHEGAPVVVLEGASGIGKSTLARAFLDELRPHATVLAGRCSVRETVAYNAFDGAVDGLARLLRTRSPEERRALISDGGALARVFPVLGGLASEDERVEERDADALRLRAFRAVRALLARLAHEEPLALFVDDWQWADRDSEALLAEILKGPEPPRLLVVLTRRSARDGAEASLPWAAERIALGPLSLDVARALARSIVVDDARAEAIAAAAGGHPLFLHEMVLRGSDSPSPADLDGAIRARVAALGDDDRAIVELAAIATTPIDEVVLARAAAIEPAAALRAIERLRVGRLVRTEIGRAVREGAALEPFHDRVREAILEGLAPARRVSLHARIADSLRASGLDAPEALVFHLAEAGAHEEAARAAEQAAARAEAALAFDRAASLLRERLRLPSTIDDAAARRAVELRLADALANAHRAVEAAELFVRVAEGETGVSRARALRRAAELFTISGDLERGRAILARLLDEAGEPLPASPASALAALAQERARLAVRGLDVRAGTTDARTVERAELLRSVAQGFGMIDNLCGAVYQARALRAALDLGEPSRAAVALAIESIFRASVSTKGRAAGLATLARAEALARRCGDPEPACWIDAAHAMIVVLAEPKEVERLARAEARFASSTTGQTWALDSLRLVQAMCLRVIGDFDAVRVFLPEHLRDARRRSDRYLETTLRRGGSFLWLVDDQVDEARALLAETRWTSWREGFHIQHWAELDALSELDLYTGWGADALERRAPMFRALRWSLVQRLQRVRVLAQGLLGRLLLARAAAGRARAASLLECAWIARGLDDEGVGYASTRAAMLRAGIAAIRGRDDDVIRELRRAIELGERHGLQLSTAAARARLAPRIGGDGGRGLAAVADAWMRAQRVRSPERMLEVEAPGFG